MQDAGRVAQRHDKRAAMNAQPVRKDSFPGEIGMIGRSLGGVVPYFCRLLASRLAHFLFGGLTLALGLGELSLVFRDLTIRQRPSDVGSPRALSARRHT